MPKKNGFYFFMLKRQAELEEKGEKISLAKIADMLNQEWLEMSQAEKSHFKEIAILHNEKEASSKIQPVPEVVAGTSYNEDKSDDNSQPPYKFDSESMETGKEITDLHTVYPYGEHDLAVRLHLMTPFSNNISDANLPIVLVNVCNYNDEPIIPAEVSLCVFSAEKGIYDNYSALIDPQEYPDLKEHDVEANAKLLALPMPNYEKRLQNYEKVVSQLEFYITAHSRKYFGEGVLFCLSRDMEKIDSCLKWIFKRAGEGFSFKLLSLEILIHYLSMRRYTEQVTNEALENLNAALNMDEKVDDEDDLVCSEWETAVAEMTTRTEGLIKYPLKHPLVEKGIFLQPRHVFDFLQFDNYACYQELACLYHMSRGDGVPQCALNISNRYAYNLLHVLVKRFGVIPQPGIHYPVIDKMNCFLERKRRIEMLKRWAFIDYTALADGQKYGDLDLLESQ